MNAQCDDFERPRAHCDARALDRTSERAGGGFFRTDANAQASERAATSGDVRQRASASSPATAQSRAHLRVRAHEATRAADRRRPPPLPQLSRA